MKKEMITSGRDKMEKIENIVYEVLTEGQYIKQVVRQEVNKKVGTWIPQSAIDNCIRSLLQKGMIKQKWIQERMFFGVEFDEGSNEE
jgi:hypothetical protein